MTRFAAERRVVFFEEPVADPQGESLELRSVESGVLVATPHLAPADMDNAQSRFAGLQRLLNLLIDDQDLESHVAWYYTPMALPWSAHLAPVLTVYDCMDELSRFKGAPTEMGEREGQLLARADLVLTGGQSLYEAKTLRHPRVFCFPSSVDAPHFRRARSPLPVPEDQRAIPSPRLGYAGVIDERIDLPLLERVAAMCPDFHLVLVGPVVKIDPATLPRLPNIHYLGLKPYTELPAYLAGWDVALLPFARNEATRYISPTKTPEYLAAGRPVVSTSIRDVVRPYGKEQLVHIADTAEEWIAAIHAALSCDLRALRARADKALARMSWDTTVRQMNYLMNDQMIARKSSRGPLDEDRSAAVGS